MTHALDRFGLVDTLVNDVRVIVAQPFTQHSEGDISYVVVFNRFGFFHAGDVRSGERERGAILFPSQSGTNDWSILGG